MTEPLTPPGCDLRDFQFMPIEIVRLFGSRFHAIANDAEWRAGITLWLKSFHQVPAASIPDDDVELARLAEFGRDLKSWKKVREVALHGWIKCSDGRLYHPVVAEKALEAIKKKEVYRERSQKANAKRWNRLDKSDEHQGIEGVRKDGTRHVEGDASAIQQGSIKDSNKDSNKDSLSLLRDSKGTGTGTGTEGKTDKSVFGAAKRGTRLPDDFVMPEEWLTEAVSKGLPLPVAKVEAEKFALYWQAKSGKDATKVDWRKTWVSWVLNADKARGRDVAPDGKRYFGV